MGVLLIGAGLIILISLATYSPLDFPNGSRAPEEVGNWGGRVGAETAYALFITLGYVAYAVPFLCGIWGWDRLRGAPMSRTLYHSTGIFATALILGMGAGLPQYSRESAFRFGGWFGTQTCDLVLIPYLGRIGAAVLLGALLVAAVILTTDIHPVPALRRAVDLLRRAGGRLVAAFKLPGVWARNLLRGVRARRVARALQRSHADEDLEEEYDEPEEEDTEPEETLHGEVVEGADGRIEDTLDRVPAVRRADALGDGENHGAREVDTPDPASGVRTSGGGGGAEKPPAPRARGRRPRDRSRLSDSSSSGYRAPQIDLLDEVPSTQGRIDKDLLQSNAQLLEQALGNFDVAGRVVEVSPGPVVTRYEVEPAAGVKVSRILTLTDDLARVMSANGIRIQAPVPGKSVVGVEIANQDREMVFLREILESRAFRQAESKLTMALGKTISGDPFVADLARMPHLLVAGATGSGKSVCINALICSMLFKSSPDEVRLLMVDPKVVELTVYDGIPHLLVPVVTEPKKAAEALKWAVAEMEVRYQKLAKMGVRNLADYNRKVEKLGTTPDEDGVEPPSTLPYLVIVIDEFADLMLTAPAEVETSLMALAQKSRAVGIHIILATQRPSVNVITGVIKANFPSRIAFQVATKTDSRTILDMNGAERLLGRGDMLFLPGGQAEPVRVHGAYVSGEETEALVEALKATDYQTEPADVFERPLDIAHAEDDRDELFDEAARIVVEYQQASTSFLQRRMKVGYSRAARLMDELERAGIVGPPEGAKPRQILVTEAEMDTQDEEA